MAFLQPDFGAPLYRLWVERAEGVDWPFPAYLPFTEADLDLIARWAASVRPMIGTLVQDVSDSKGQLLEVYGPCDVNPPDYLVFRRRHEVVTVDFSNTVLVFDSLATALASILGTDITGSIYVPPPTSGRDV